MWYPSRTRSCAVDRKLAKSTEFIRKPSLMHALRYGILLIFSTVRGDALFERIFINSSLNLSCLSGLLAKANNTENAAVDVWNKLNLLKSKTSDKFVLYYEKFACIKMWFMELTGVVHFTRVEKFFLNAFQNFKIVLERFQADLEHTEIWN